MRAGIKTWSQLDRAARQASVRVAGETLRQGGLVIAPTESVYGVFAHAGSARAVAKLRMFSGVGATGEPRFTWHAPAADAVRSSVALPTAVHRRLIDRLLPGPVRIVLEQGDQQIAAALSGMRVGPGVIDDGAHIALRVSSHEITREVIGIAGVPVIAERLGATPWGCGDRSDLAVGETGDFDGAVLDTGELPTRGPSATVRLRLNGAFEVASGGGLEEMDVMEALRKRILFVCTGNTCRSPMAEAIARQLAADRPEDGVELVFESAGVATGDGMPASPEAVRVVEKLGGDLRSHRSRRLSASMVEKAERVYAMTESHRAAVLALAPGSADKVALLDPGRDVPDPIGGPEEVYRETADRLREAVAARFEEHGL